MKRTILTLAALTALAAAAPAASATDAATPAAVPAPQFQFRLTMRDGDAAPTHPTLTALAGETATVMIANDSYSMRITATSDAQGKVALVSQIAAWTPRGIENYADNVELVANGEPGMVAFRRTDPATGASSDVRIEISVRPLD